MKSYDNCPLKRGIQSLLFPKKANIILGLSSPDINADYINVLPKHKDLFLVNYCPNDTLINCNSLVGMFDMLLHKGIVPDFIDADFCGSIINSGDDLIYIYNKCKKLNKNVIISFTFSIRGITLEETFKWLSQFNVHISKRQTILKNLWSHRQFAYSYGECIHYRESGEQMLSGIIK